MHKVPEIPVAIRDAYVFAIIKAEIGRLGEATFSAEYQKPGGGVKTGAILELVFCGHLVRCGMQRDDASNIFSMIDPHERQSIEGKLLHENPHCNQLQFEYELARHMIKVVNNTMFR